MELPRQLDSLSYRVWDSCATSAYYLLNNLILCADSSAPIVGQWTWGGTVNVGVFSVPSALSLGYFGEGFNHGNPTPDYCGICDPMQYSSQIMTNPALRANTEHGLDDFRAAVATGTLPAVSFLKPGNDDGHPGYSTLAHMRPSSSRPTTRCRTSRRCGTTPPGATRMFRRTVPRPATCSTCSF